DMVFRDIAPEPTVFRSVPIVAHHPIVILFKGIGIGNFSINEDLISVYINIISFVFLNYFFINGKYVYVNRDRFSFFRNINGSHIVHSTCMCGILWKNGSIWIFV